MVSPPDPEITVPGKRQKLSILYLIIPGLLIESGFLYLLRSGDWNQNIPSFLAIFFLTFCIYLYVTHMALEDRFLRSRRFMPVILSFAVLFRLTLFWSLPSISEDFYRYIWDGKVAVSGRGPYDHPPQAEELAGLRDANYDRINHKDVLTPYPPFAQELFHGLAIFSSNLFIWKAGLMIFDLLLIEALRRILTKEGLSSSLLLLYAWHPLAIVEFAGSAHIDVVSMSLLFASILLAYSSRKSLAGITMAMSVLTKYLPLAAFPWLWKKGGWRFLVLFAVFGIALMLPYYTDDLRFAGGVSTFYKKWRFNDSFFGILYDWFGGAEPARRWGFFFVMLTGLFSWLSNFSVFRGLFMIVGATLLFSPVVHPWYVCWMIPILVFHPNRPWIFFSGWIALAYLIRFLYPDTVWEPVTWLRILIYVPFYLFLVIDLFRGTSSKNQLSYV